MSLKYNSEYVNGPFLAVTLKDMAILKVTNLELFLSVSLSSEQ